MMPPRKFNRSLVWAMGLCLVTALILPGVSQAKNGREIDASVDAAMNRFMTQVKGSKEFVQDAKGPQTRRKQFRGNHT